MRWRRISEAQVRECVAGALLEEPAGEGKIHSWMRAGERFLRVTWMEEQGALVVITSVLKRRQPEGWGK